MGNRRPTAPPVMLSPRPAAAVEDVSVTVGGRTFQARYPGRKIWEMVAPHLNLDGTINNASPNEKTVVLSTFLAASLPADGVIFLQDGLNAGRLHHPEILAAAAYLVDRWWPQIDLLG